MVEKSRTEKACDFDIVREGWREMKRGEGGRRREEI